MIKHGSFDYTQYKQEITAYPGSSDNFAQALKDAIGLSDNFTVVEIESVKSDSYDLTNVKVLQFPDNATKLFLTSHTSGSTNTYIKVLDNNNASYRCGSGGNIPNTCYIDYLYNDEDDTLILTSHSTSSGSAGFTIFLSFAKENNNYYTYGPWEIQFKNGIKGIMKYLFGSSSSTALPDRLWVDSNKSHALIVPILREEIDEDVWLVSDKMFYNFITPSNGSATDAGYYTIKTVDGKYKYHFLNQYGGAGTKAPIGLREEL